VCLVLGVAGAAPLCWTGINDIKTCMLVDSELCLVLDEQWVDGLDTNWWKRDQPMQLEIYITDGSCQSTVMHQ
jgi:hypothetical protein